MDFNGIIGTNLHITGLTRSIADKKIVQSLIIQGDYGTGKKTLANIYASALLCESTNPPCGQCRSCKKSMENVHPDIIYVDSGDKKTIGIDNIKQIVKSSLIKPNESEYKIYIIDNAQKATPQAQNALLKIIEEPKKHLVIILLCTSLANILQTIISRCCIVNMPNLSSEQIQNVLKSRGIDGIESAAYAQISNSSLGKAIDYATNNKFLEQRDEYINLLIGADNNKTTAYKQIVDKKDKLQDMISVWQSFVRDCMFYKETSDTSLLENIHRLSQIKQYTTIHSKDKLLHRLNHLLEAEIRFNANVQKQLVIDYVMINL